MVSSGHKLSVSLEVGHEKKIFLIDLFLKAGRQKNIFSIDLSFEVSHQKKYFFSIDLFFEVIHQKRSIRSIYSSKWSIESDLFDRSVPQGSPLKKFFRSIHSSKWPIKKIFFPRSNSSKKYFLNHFLLHVTEWFQTLCQCSSRNQ